MKRLCAILLAALLLCMMPLWAASDEAGLSADMMLDSAGVLTPGEQDEIDGMLAAISTRQRITVAAATVDNIYGRDALEYADDFYDRGGYGDDGVLLLLSMGERDWALLAVGEGYQAVGDDAQEYIMDQVLPLLKQDRYAEAFSLYGTLCDELITRYRSGQPYKAPFPWAVCLLISLGLGLLTALITVSVMKGKLKTVGRQTGAAAYARAGSMQVTQQQDVFLYSNVTRVPRPKETSGRGGSGGGSCGGRSGKF